MNLHAINTNPNIISATRTAIPEDRQESNKDDLLIQLRQIINNTNDDDYDSLVNSFIVQNLAIMSGDIRRPSVCYLSWYWISLPLREMLVILTCAKLTVDQICVLNSDKLKLHNAMNKTLQNICNIYEHSYYGVPTSWFNNLKLFSEIINNDKEPYGLRVHDLAYNLRSSYYLKSVWDRSNDIKQLLFKPLSENEDIKCLGNLYTLYDNLLLADKNTLHNFITDNNITNENITSEQRHYLLYLLGSRYKKNYPDNEYVTRVKTLNPNGDLRYVYYSIHPDDCYKVAPNTEAPINDEEQSKSVIGEGLGGKVTGVLYNGEVAYVKKKNNLNNEQRESNVFTARLFHNLSDESRKPVGLNHVLRVKSRCGSDRLTTIEVCTSVSAYGGKAIDKELSWEQIKQLMELTIRIHRAGGYSIDNKKDNYILATNGNLVRIDLDFDSLVNSNIVAINSSNTYFEYNNDSTTFINLLQDLPSGVYKTTDGKYFQVMDDYILELILREASTNMSIYINGQIITNYEYNKLFSNYILACDLVGSSLEIIGAYERYNHTYASCISQDKLFEFQCEK